MCGKENMKEMGCDVLGCWERPSKRLVEGLGDHHQLTGTPGTAPIIADLTEDPSMPGVCSLNESSQQSWFCSHCAAEGGPSGPRSCCWAGLLPRISVVLSMM